MFVVLRASQIGDPQNRAQLLTHRLLVSVKLRKIVRIVVRGSLESDAFILARLPRVHSAKGRVANNVAVGNGVEPEAEGRIPRAANCGYEKRR